VDLVAYIADRTFKTQRNGRHDGDIVVADPRGRSDSRRHIWNLPTIDVVSPHRHGSGDYGGDDPDFLAQSC
jgi:hypothetical protein